MIFWSITVALSLSLLWILLRPVRMPESVSRNVLAAALFEEAMSALRNDLDNGRVDAQTFAEQEQQLKLRFLQEAGGVDESPSNHASSRAAQQPARMGVWTVMALAAVWVAYLSMVPPAGRDWLHTQATVAPLVEEWFAGHTEGLTDVRTVDFLAVLQRRLQARPDAQGSHMLGYLYAELGLYEQAVEVYRQLAAMTPDDPAVQLQLAAALVSANDGRYTDASDAAFQRVLAMQPKHEGALMQLGMSHFAGGDYAGAIGYWEALLAFQIAGSEVVPVLERAIARAREMQALATRKLAEVTVRDIPAGWPDTARLFLIARQPGVAMPVAVRNWPIGGSQMLLALSAADSMLPQASMAEVKELELEVRLSVSGMATRSDKDRSVLLGTVKLPYTGEVSLREH